MTIFGKTNRLASKTNFFFLLLCCLLRRAKMPLSTFEANPTLHRGVNRASFSLFTLASSCANAYFREYAIIDFLTDRLVFLNTVTYMVLFYLFFHLFPPFLSLYSPHFIFVPFLLFSYYSPNCLFFLISSPTFWICPFFI